MRVTFEQVREAMGARDRFPCACPDCGWDDDGHLEVVDRYATDFPPIPWCDLREVRGDDDERGALNECPACDAWLDPDEVVEVQRCVR